MKISIKPLSVNECWRGRRFKTPAYTAYERELLYLLPSLTIPKNKKLELKIKVGFSSKNSDADNIAKPFCDILQKRYGFNDKWIYKLTIEKEDVEKKAEFIDFQLFAFNLI